MKEKLFSTIAFCALTFLLLLIALVTNPLAKETLINTYFDNIEYKYIDFDSMLFFNCIGGDSFTFENCGIVEIVNCYLTGTIVGDSTDFIIFNNSTIKETNNYAFYTENTNVETNETIFKNNSGGRDEFATFRVAGGDVDVSLLGGSFINEYSNNSKCVYINSSGLIQVIQPYGNICFIDTSSTGEYPFILWGGAKFRKSEIIGGATRGVFNQFVGWGPEDFYNTGEIIFHGLDSLENNSCIGGILMAIHMENPESIPTAFITKLGTIDLQGGDQGFTIGDSSNCTPRTKIEHMYIAKYSFYNSSRIDTILFPTNTFDNTWCATASPMLTTKNNLLSGDLDMFCMLIDGNSNKDTCFVVRNSGINNTPNLSYLLEAFKTTVE